MAQPRYSGVMRIVPTALLLIAASAASAALPAPDFRAIGRGRAMVTFHNGCVVDYRNGERRTASRYCTPDMTGSADRRAALSGAFRMNYAVAEPIVVRLPGREVQVGFAGVACNYVFSARGRLVRAMGTYCNDALYRRALELQGRARRN